MKVLVVRFSSIGDIVLTKPVVSAIKKQFPETEIHYLTKNVFHSLLSEDPNIRMIHGIDKSINEKIEALKSEKFDWVIDLHNNLRTKSLKFKLRTKSSTYTKLNIRKWFLVKFKFNRLPNKHVVDRYFEAVSVLNVKNDGTYDNFQIAKLNQVDVSAELNLIPSQYITVAIGAQYATKRMPVEMMVALFEKIKQPIILIGGKVDFNTAEEIIDRSNHPEIINTCGKYNIQQSADIVRQSAKLLTNDTGMMHIAATFNVPIVSVWGSTVPDFGMYPYRPLKKESYSIHQVKGLGCRPCSKIGFQACPKKHFNCMKQQNIEEIASELVSKK